MTAPAESEGFTKEVVEEGTRSRSTPAVHLGAHRRRFVIVGNGIAGTTAAEQLRRNDPDAQVVLLAEEPYPLYNRIALPPFLKRKVTQQKVMIKGLEWHANLGIDLRLCTRATSVDSESRVVVTSDGEALPYDALLVATGGRSLRLNVPGADACGVYNFQTLDDAREIDHRLETARHAVVVGGSYIAYELAEAFRSRGLHVTWLIRGPWFLRRILEEEGGRLVDAIAASHGVDVIHGEEVAEVHARDGWVCGVTTTSGRHLDADIVGVGIGIARNVELLAPTGAEIRQGILTDAYLRTTVPGIFAAGDVAEFYDQTLECSYAMGTWDNATNHGKVVAANMLGDERAYVEVPTYSTTLFHSRIVAVGATPDVLPDIDGLHGVSHTAQTYRRLFFKDDRLVGAVLIGERRGRQRLIELIQQRVPIPPHERARLVDTSVPL